jgi:hypothetical protein
VGYKRRPIPPKTRCHNCGAPHRSWSAGRLCLSCSRTAGSGEGESLRDFRKRLKGSGN